MKRFIFITLFIQLGLQSLSLAQTQPTLTLFQAIKLNDIELAKKSIQQGADLNSLDNVEAPTKTVLTYATALNRLEIVQLLIKSGADINQVRPLDLHTSLMIAATRNLPTIASVLISGGADINKTTLINRTALQIAAFNGSLEVARILVQQKNMDVNNRGKKCALFVASRQQHLDIVQLLLGLKGTKKPSEKCLSSAKEIALQTKNEQLIQMFKYF